MAWTGDYQTVTTNTTWGTRLVAPQSGWYEVKGDAIQVTTFEPEEKMNMRGLFEVFIVNPEAATVDHTVVLIASDENNAKLKAALAAGIEDLDDFDVICRRLGDVRPKAKVKEVRVVKD